MKIVQSLWTKPMMNTGGQPQVQTLSGGWLDRKFHFMSWALSCLLLSRYYKDIELVTDSLGKYLLINTLRLPYTRVVEVLDSINHYDSSLWAMGKLIAIQQQQSPFLHVDSDVYIWASFARDLEEAPLVAQNLEQGYPFYATLLNQINMHFPYIPESVRANGLRMHSANAYNAGILGGNNLDFFRAFTKEAIQFVDNNVGALHKVDLSMFNCMYEQHLFYCLSRKWELPVHCYSQTIQEDRINLEFKGIHNFIHAPESREYMHLFGDIKKNPLICQTLYNKLKHSFPQYLERVEHVVNECNDVELQSL